MSYDSAADTLRHIKRVNELLLEFAKEMITRAQVHDSSKLESPEKEAFDVATPKLTNLTYGAPEYKQALKELGPALEHHYKENSHHPEHYGERGVEGMNLADLVEMFFDWKAASERHKDGDIFRSIQHNRERFSLSPQLVEIFYNTAVDMFSE